MRGAALDAVLPALHGAVDDRRGLRALELGGAALGGHDGQEVAPVLHVDHVPVVQVKQLHRVPLHVFAGAIGIATDVVGVDRGLVPVQVHDQVGEPGRPRGRERFGDAAGREATLTFDHVHARRIGAIGVARPESESQRRREAHARSAGRELDERRRWGRVPVEGLDPELDEERRAGRGVAAEAE
jgi:hypothetical protein